MAALLTVSHVWTLLLLSSYTDAYPDAWIRPKSGADVTLPCRADENQPVLDAEWTRTDPEPEVKVLSFRNQIIDPEGQSPSFRNRVGLLDVQNGDASLVLKNVTNDDTGRYECRVKQTNDLSLSSGLNSDLISVVDLTVLGQTIRAEPGQTVILPCRYPDGWDIRAVDWKVRSLSVLRYENGQMAPDRNHPSFKDRVDLQDREMKDGDASLVLRNTKTDESATYVCWVETGYPGNSEQYWLLLASVVHLNVAPPPPSPDQIITAEPGQSVILPCRYSDGWDIRAVDWQFRSLSVLGYENGQMDPNRQDPFFKNRVDLQDREMKDRDASLVLRDTKTDDSGTYVCWVKTGDPGNSEQYWILLASIVHLNVAPPLPPPPGSDEPVAMEMVPPNQNKQGLDQDEDDDVTTEHHV